VKIVRAFPRRVREIENCWIPMRDGCRLAARIWLPEDAEVAPVPAILEYIPYRKRDLTRSRDDSMHHYFAGHGYAAIRVDLRGSGESDGILLDEYLEQEQSDAVEVIAWLAAQPWCSGAVGMMGKSWGGFNSLQVAARRPAALRAIITVCSTDDRYADDAHYMGGCLLNENLVWGSVLLGYNAYPPDPELVGPRWRAMWLERLERTELLPETWIRHPRRDAYWKHGSVCEDYGAITCAVYAIGGWADGYTNAIPRLLAGLRCPRKGLIGPWGHVYPHDGGPGPAIGFLQEALRWWARWLKGIDSGIMDEPMLRVWMQESVPPKPFYEERPGRWVAEQSWPSPRIAPRRWIVNRSQLDDEPQPEFRIVFRSPETTGVSAGDWCGFGLQCDAPIDQREDAGKSVIFDSAPLESRLEILGAPEVSLELAVDRPNALLAVRLDDVAADGSTTRVTYGVLNLTHRDSHESPLPLEPGRRYQVRIRLNSVAHAFAAGHKFRVAVSTSYWPLAWPSPEPVVVTIFTGSSSTLELPIRKPRPEDAQLAAFAEPEAAPASQYTPLRTGSFARTVSRDLTSNEMTYTTFVEGGDCGTAGVARVDAINLEVGQSLLKRFTIRDGDPLSARAEVELSSELRRGEWSARIAVRTAFRATKKEFDLEASLVAHDGEARVFSRTWSRSVPRDLV
jgi:putative CocE/NonD family hydrolase